MTHRLHLNNTNSNIKQIKLNTNPQLKMIKIGPRKSELKGWGDLLFVEAKKCFFCNWNLNITSFSHLSCSPYSIVLGTKRLSGGISGECFWQKNEKYWTRNGCSQYALKAVHWIQQSYALNKFVVRKWRYFCCKLLASTYLSHSILFCISLLFLRLPDLLSV